MSLPNAEKVVIDMAKLAGYCLSTSHHVGMHKAAVFRSALGITATEAFVLAERIREGVMCCPATSGKADEFGQRYQVDIPMTTEVGSAVVRTAWIVRGGEDAPRLVTCYVL
ncbi:MAG: DUF6883 domain-containing protein [Gemmataceae bacterium]